MLAKETCCSLLLWGSKRVRSCISTAESIADSMMLVHPLVGAAAWDSLCHSDTGAQAVSPRCSPGPKAETWLEAGTWGSCACLCSHLASARQGDFGNQPQAVSHQPFPGGWTGSHVLGVRRAPPTLSHSPGRASSSSSIPSISFSNAPTRQECWGVWHCPRQAAPAICYP